MSFQQESEKFANVEFRRPHISKEDNYENSLFKGIRKLLSFPEIKQYLFSPQEIQYINSLSVQTESDSYDLSPASVQKLNIKFLQIQTEEEHNEFISKHKLNFSNIPDKFQNSIETCLLLNVISLYIPIFDPELLFKLSENLIIHFPTEVGSISLKCSFVLAFSLYYLTGLSQKFPPQFNFTFKPPQYDLASIFNKNNIAFLKYGFLPYAYKIHEDYKAKYKLFSDLVDFHSSFTINFTSKNPSIRKFFTSIYPHFDRLIQLLIPNIVSPTYVDCFNKLDPSNISIQFLNLNVWSLLFFLQSLLDHSNFIEADIFLSFLIEKEIPQICFKKLTEVNQDFLTIVSASIALRISGITISRYQFFSSGMDRLSLIDQFIELATSLGNEAFSSQVSFFISLLIHFIKFQADPNRLRVYPTYTSFFFLHLEEYELFPRLFDEDLEKHISKEQFDDVKNQFLKTLK